MPRVKIDYIVSFSSEDPDHPASNLLAWEVSKKKWLCKKGETSCSVVLQLTKAVKISSVHIGAYHSALVEVLVARSEKGTEQYQVMVPSCVFVPPTESRRDSAVERVRSFSSEQLQGEARDQRWDRVRVVCSQPYNKHCKYGLSFIHIDESGDDATSSAPVAQTQSVAAAVPPRMLALETYSSDEEEFRPGELFAKHHSQNSCSDTGAQIRQATSQALKNMPESNTKLMKTPISKPSSKRDSVPSSEGRSDRTRDNLLYTQDDVKPHAKIDQIVQRHKDQKDKEVHEKKVKEDRVKAYEKREKDRDKMHEKKEKEETKAQETRDRDRSQSHERRDKERRNHNNEGSARKRKKSNSPAEETPPKKKVNKDASVSSSSSKNRADDKKRRSQARAEDPGKEEVEEMEEPHTLLQDVVLVLSGYENPQRSTVRNTALALGAQVVRDWGPTCTHLICAFPNTPKLRQVRASSGDKVPVVLADWILQCSQRQLRLPWQWFATEQKYRRPEEPLPPLVPKRTDTAPYNSPSTPTNDKFDTDCDTDDEIEKVIQKQNASIDDVTTASTSDGQVQSMEVDDEPSTDEESAEEAAVPRFGGALPNFFDGHTFAIDAEGPDAEQLGRYVKAYGGLVLQLSELDEDTNVEYLVCGKTKGSTEHTSGARRVTPAWVARCLRAGRLLPPPTPLYLQWNRQQQQCL